MTGPRRAGEPAPRRWPLFLIGSPAAVAIWSGWVGLGGLCGFGIVHPLPGIAGGFQLNTAITLPIGVEAYGAYALGAWLRLPADAADPAVRRARDFARKSAVGALALGMAGQVLYHLLAAAHARHAPWPVTVLVSCLPVVTLGFGAALTHLLRAAIDLLHASPDARTGATGQARTELRRVTRTEPEDRIRTGLPGQDRIRTGLPGQVRTAPAGRARTGSGADPDARTAFPPGPQTAGRPGMPGGEVDRNGLVAAMAAEILAAAEAGEPWRPDYPALMARTGRRRSWCEKAVRDARRVALGADTPVRDAAPGTSPARTGQAPQAGPELRTEPARTELAAAGEAELAAAGSRP